MNYEVDFMVSVPEYGVLNIEADSPDEAEAEAIRQIKATEPDATSIEIEMVRKL